jgi:hypothetical protein
MKGSLSSSQLSASLSSPCILPCRQLQPLAWAPLQPSCSILLVASHQPQLLTPASTDCTCGWLTLWLLLLLLL